MFPCMGLLHTADTYLSEHKRRIRHASLFELTEMDDLDMEFSSRRWNAIVDHVTVHSDGRLVFCFQNGSEVTAVI